MVYILKHLSDFEKGLTTIWDSWTTGTVISISIEKLKENTGDRLVQKWENWLKEDDDQRIIAWKYYKLDRNWSEIQEIPENMKWYCAMWSALRPARNHRKRTKSRLSQLSLWTVLRSLWKIVLKSILIPHTIFFDQTIEVTDGLAQFIRKYAMCRLDFQIKDNLLTLPFQKLCFSGQYGDKMFPFTTQVINFTGQVTYHGYENILKGLWSRFQSCLGLDL